MTSCQTSKPVTTVRLFPCNTRFHPERELRKLTTVRYQESTKSWAGEEFYNLLMRRSEALKWIYKNCKGRYRVRPEYINGAAYGLAVLDGINYADVFVCDFDREQDALHFTLIFSDILEPKS